MVSIVPKQVYDFDPSFKDTVLQDSNILRENSDSKRSQRSLINGAIRTNRNVAHRVLHALKRHAEIWNFQAMTRRISCGSELNW